MNFAQRGNQIITVPPHTHVMRTSKAPIKSKFSLQEDAKLLSLVLEHGTKNWIQISQLMGTRNPRQCRERWNNYINPDLRKDPWTPEEDKILEEKYAEIGPKWNKLARFFENRSDNSIRNRWMMISRHRSVATNPNNTNNVEPVSRAKSCKPQLPTSPETIKVVSSNLGDFKSFEEPFIFNTEFDFTFEEKRFDAWENFSFF
ncbi:Myb-like DNA-binding domain containing protein [Histomonas meleagridis]|uniref:Myb-like DNA-binding domain containing protein n=1 Tax=Histomonas meleagridis TaxID=135588 RepID=UPI003559B46A|nr:Myb-like DNA-binding domain containing protein [Histomonas meleagridis]KAH0805556.1 Myb-like DNA-binding domain containing protein [Histomonas meleagridis]